MKKKLLPLLLFGVLTIMQVHSVKAQNDAFFNETKIVDRSPYSSFSFDDFNSEDDLNFSNFALTDVPIGNGLLLMAGFAIAFKSLKRRNN